MARASTMAASPNPVVRLQTLLTLALLAGCGRYVLGSIPTMVDAPRSTGVKMLRPSRTATVCHVTVFGVPLDDTRPLEAGVSRLLESDPEADTLTNVTVHATALTTGIYNRSCITLQGDVGRLVSTVLLPGGTEHGQHH